MIFRHSLRLNTHEWTGGIADELISKFHDL